MDTRGYRAFLYSTARDQIPVRGIWLTVQRRNDVEPAAGDRAFDGAAILKGVCESNGTHTTGRPA